VVDRVVRELTDHASACDYASNVVKRTYPRGLDTEAFWRDTLARMDRLGTSRAAREHVTVVARLERPELFLCRDVTGTRDASGHRWTVDTGDDLDFVRGLYRDLGLDDGRGSWEDVLAFLDAHPERIRVDAEQTWDPGRKS
jgi:spore coat polysaccharide biosynthesis protein SpsF